MTFEYKLELACKDEDASRLIEIIRTAASTGRRKSASIFVVDIEQAISVS